MIPLMAVYGPRDAASVLMHRGHKVARVWRGQGADLQRAWKLDGQLVTLAALEDAAEQYERLRYRWTDRKPVRAIMCGPRPPTAGDVAAVEDFGRKLRILGRAPGPERQAPVPTRSWLRAFTGWLLW